MEKVFPEYEREESFSRNKWSFFTFSLLYHVYMRDLNKAENFWFIYTYNKLTQLIQIMPSIVKVIQKMCKEFTTKLTTINCHCRESINRMMKWLSWGGRIRMGLKLLTLGLMLLMGKISIKFIQKTFPNLSIITQNPKKIWITASKSFHRHFTPQNNKITK